MDICRKTTHESNSSYGPQSLSFRYQRGEESHVLWSFKKPALGLQTYKDGTTRGRAA